MEEARKQMQEMPLDRKYSNDMKDAVRTGCQICGKVFKFVAMRGHTKKNHGLTIMAYREKYGKLVPLEEIYHRCGLCGHELILDSDNVMIHLKNSHNITHAHYNAQFMVTARGRPKVDENRSDKTGLHVTLKPAKQNLQMEIAKSNGENHNESQTIGKRQLENKLPEDISSKQQKKSLNLNMPVVNNDNVGNIVNENRTENLRAEDRSLSQMETEDGDSTDEEIEENALIDLMMADNHLTKDEEVDMQEQLKTKLAMEVELARKLAKRAEEVALEREKASQEKRWKGLEIDIALQEKRDRKLALQEQVSLKRKLAMEEAVEKEQNPFKEIAMEKETSGQLEPEIDSASNPITREGIDSDHPIKQQVQDGFSLPKNQNDLKETAQKKSTDTNPPTKDPPRDSIEIENDDSIRKHESASKTQSIEKDNAEPIATDLKQKVPGLNEMRSMTTKDLLNLFETTIQSWASEADD